MTHFIVSPSFWELFPQAKIGVVLLKDYQTSSDFADEITELLRESNLLAKTYLTEDVFSDNAVIQTYRKAYQQFKTKKGARSSIEALLKRTASNHPVNSINPLVDIYNACSLRYALPVGAEDIDSFVGDLQLTKTNGGDEFYLIGEDRNQPTLPGEICYKDDVGAVCRCLNWRDGARTMITEHTQNAFVVIELLDPSREQDLQEALNFLADKAQSYLNAKVSQFILTPETPKLPLT